MLQGLASSHAGLSLAGDVVVHALLRLPSCPFKVASQQDLPRARRRCSISVATPPRYAAHPAGCPDTSQRAEPVSSCTSFGPAVYLFSHVKDCSQRRAASSYCTKELASPPQVGIPSFVRPTAAVVCSAVSLISFSRCAPTWSQLAPDRQEPALLLGRLRYIPLP